MLFRSPKQYERPTADGLQGLIEVSLAITTLPEFLGRSEPTVITVSTSFTFRFLGGLLTPFFFFRW